MTPYEFGYFFLIGVAIVFGIAFVVALVLYILFGGEE